MKVARWVLVFVLYLAAELLGASAPPLLEALDGEAEESIHRAGQTRLTRVDAARRSPAATRTTAATLRSMRPAPVSPAAVSRSTPVPKTPASVPESASASEDH
jgi:hypothetical protein